MINPILFYTALGVIGLTFLLNLFYLKTIANVYLNQRLQIGLFFVILFFLRASISFVQGFRLFLNPEKELLSDTIALGGILVGFLFILITESYWSVHFSNVRISIASIFATLTTLIILFTRNETIGKAIQSQFSLFIQFTVPLFFFYVAITIFNLLRKMERYATETQGRTLKLLRYIIAANYIGSPLFIMIGLFIYATPQNPLPEFNNSTFIWFTLIPSISYLMTDVGWYYAVVKYKSFNIFQIQKIEQIILINSIGLAFYRYSPKEEIEMDETLISGAIYAIQSVLREGTKIAGSLRLIQLGDYFFLFNSSNGLTTTIITTQPTRYLENLVRLITESIGAIHDPEAYDVNIDKIDRTTRNIVEFGQQT